MREDWDQRARKNAMYYIATTYDPNFWDPETFFEEGEKEAIALVQPVLDRLGFIPTGKRILEIGCGIGRLFLGFAELGFNEIWGVDVSAEMVERGRKWCPVSNARFLLMNGQDLTGVDNDSIDYCFSYFVFPHVPDPDIIWRYLDELWRVLKPGGACQLHFRGHYPFSERILRVIPLRLHPLIQISYQLVTLRWLRGYPIRPLYVPGSLRTWCGTAIDPEQFADRLVQLGFTDVEIFPESSRRSRGRFWAIGMKPQREPRP